MSQDFRRPPPSDPRKKVCQDVDGCEVSAEFYPGFASRIQVNGVQLYLQSQDGPDPFVLPEPEAKPDPRSVTVISSTRGYTVTITLDDPDHVVDSIEMVMRDPRAPESIARRVGASGSAGGVAAFQSGGPDKVTIVNTPTLCPPNCA